MDLSILSDEAIRRAIEEQAEFNSKQGLTIDPNKGEGDDLDIEEAEEKEAENPKDNQDKPEGNDCIEEKTDSAIKRYESQIKTYYQRLLFFSFLTKDKVSSLDDVLKVIDNNDID